MRTRRGFTLIEMLVTIAIFTGIMTLVSLFALDISAFTLQLEQELDAVHEVNAALNAMTVDLRSANTAANGSYGIASAASGTLIFFSDVDVDGVTEQVRYFFGTSTFERGVIEPTGTPAVYTTSSEAVRTVVHNLIATSTNSFSYYGATYTGTELPLSPPIDVAAIRTIRFRVTVDKYQGSTPGPLTASIVINLRNLR